MFIQRGVLPLPARGRQVQHVLPVGPQRVAPGSGHVSGRGLDRCGGDGRLIRVDEVWPRTRYRPRRHGPARNSLGHKAIASDYWSLVPFVGDEAASLARSAATSPVALQRAHRSFRSLSDDPYPLQWGHHL
jgi:hypothetical protein